MSSSMFLKRKLSRDEDDDDRRDYTPTKHVKLATPSADSNDMAMSDAGMNVVPFPTFATPFPGTFAQLAINTSSTSDRSPNNSISSLPSASPLSAYPAFDLYPELETPMDVDMEASPSTHHHSSSISSINSTTSSSPTMATGLLQPVSSLQHGGNCTSVPRLRMSSHKGIHGTRTLWSHCESCGAIEMVSV
ncbi:hypothetical protein FRC00_006711 [Tulasnella sp. 408]|nr:hypothetical protein FRC00_006711 [Tulasnella sp. 408]